MTDDVQEFRPGSTLQRLYPEVRAGGFTRADGFVEFYTRVNALLDSDSEVLDFGAGRGLWASEPMAPLHKRLRAFHERVKAVHGVDVDPVVLDNPTLESAQVIGPSGPIPYDDASFDTAVEPVASAPASSAIAVASGFAANASASSTFGRSSFRPSAEASLPRTLKPRSRCRAPG